MSCAPSAPGCGASCCVGPAGALLCGLIFGFSPPRFLRLEQLHLAAIQWLPFCLAFLHAYLDEGRVRDLRFAAACFTLQALSSGHGTVFLVMAVVGLLGYRAALGEPIAFLRRVRDLGLAGAVLLTPAALLMLPYHAVQVGVGLRRSLGTLDNWAINDASFFASPSRLQFRTGPRRPGLDHSRARASLFPGYLPLQLGTAALVPLWQRLPRSQSGGTAARGAGLEPCSNCWSSCCSR